MYTVGTIFPQSKQFSSITVFFFYCKNRSNLELSKMYKELVFFFLYCYSNILSAQIPWCDIRLIEKFAVQLPTSLTVNVAVFQGKGANIPGAIGKSNLIPLEYRCPSTFVTGEFGTVGKKGSQVQRRRAAHISPRTTFTRRIGV